MNSSIPQLNTFSSQELNDFFHSVRVHYQLSATELTDQTLLKGQGVLNDTGALCINTGEFTGRSPKDKFIVRDAMTEQTIDWGGFNNPIEEKYFLQLKNKLIQHLNSKTARFPA